jgi:predicted homoserine dehydrogenase-like protein
MGLAQGCTVLRDLARDTPVTYADVALPTGRTADRLRAEQNTHFA